MKTSNVSLGLKVVACAAAAIVLTAGLQLVLC